MRTIDCFGTFRASSVDTLGSSGPFLGEGAGRRRIGMLCPLGVLVAAGCAAQLKQFPAGSHPQLDPQDALVLMGFSADKAVARILIEGGGHSFELGGPIEPECHRLTALPVGRYRITEVRWYPMSPESYEAALRGDRGPLPQRMAVMAGHNSVYVSTEKMKAEHWAFQVRPGHINYVGDVVIQIDNTQRRAAVMLVNRSSGALEFLEQQFPDSLAEGPPVYGGQGDERFFEMAAELTRVSP